MFDSLEDQIKHDDHVEISRRERIIKALAVFALSILLFGGLYLIWRIVNSRFGMVVQGLRATVLLGRRLGLSLASSVEWDPIQRHYDVSGIDGTAAIVQPYTVRPGLSLALEWP